MVEYFFGSPVDIVVFGRTLYAMVEEHQGVLFVNPGSPTLPRNLMKLGNVALLELAPGECRASVIDLADYR
jgi:predicted phosphodiesterase